MRGLPGEGAEAQVGEAGPTVLGAQQAVEDLLHHDGVEFDELRQGLDHLFLQGRQGGSSAVGVGLQPLILSSSYSLWPLRAELSP